MKTQFKPAFQATVITTVAISLLLASGCVSSRQRQESRIVVSYSKIPQAGLPVLDADSGLDDYLAYAALNNEGLKAAFHKWKASLERIPQAEALPDPRFNYAYFVRNVETRVGPQEHKVGVMQMFPWFGKLKLRGDDAAARAAAAREVYVHKKLNLFKRVKAAYYEYWYLGQAIAVTRNHTALVQNMETVARTRYKTGTAPHSAVVQAQVELGKLEDRLLSLNRLKEPVAARLNAALNRVNSNPPPCPESLPELDTSFSDEQAQKALSQANPDLQRLGHLVEKEEAGVALARKNYFPDISLGVDYVVTDEAVKPELDESGKDPVIAMVSVNLPIWHSKYRAAEREALLRKNATEKELNDTSHRLSASLQMALYKLRDAERKIDLYGDTLIPKARQSLTVTRQGFEAGETGFIALIDAERMLLDFQLSHKRALADRGQQLAEVEMLTGAEKTEEEKIKPQAKCPVMGGKINKDLYVDHDGKRIYVCCRGCIGKVKRNPEKYIKELEDKGITVDPVTEQENE